MDTPSIVVPFRGRLLLEQSLWNKGAAFTEDERQALGLVGLLPPHVETLDDQAARAYEAFQQKPTDLERHIYLRALQDTNETLYYRLILDHLAEMVPIIYTPTVGLACQKFSHIFRRPRGLFLAYPERDVLECALANAAAPNVQVIVVTDGERILGLGDQGANGMGIPIGKLSLYAACAGIHPAATLPVLLDAGTDNEDNLRDPLYVGWRHPRMRGAEYDAFIERFIQGVIRTFPGVLLQWEDFAQANATRLLERYRDRLCSFNDDIQGTAAVVLGTLLAALSLNKGRLREQRIAVVGAGSAGCGISEQLVRAMRHDGLTDYQARGNLFLIDKPGLLHDGLPGLRPFQQPLAQPRERVRGWQADGRPIGLLDVMQHARPTILIGVCGQPAAFTEAAIRTMARHVERPIIFPLSNPTSRSEANPADLLVWTEGRALVATGSSFADVAFAGRLYPMAQCNNSYTFPGIGLGVLAAGARRVTDGMFMAAAQALAETSPARHDPSGPLLPPLAEARRVAQVIAHAVARAAQQEGVAEKTSPEELDRRIALRMWQPRYCRLVPRVGQA